MNPLPLSRSRLIQAGAEIRDRQDAWDWGVAIVVNALVFGLVLVASAIAGMLP